MPARLPLATAAALERSFKQQRIFLAPPLSLLLLRVRSPKAVAWRERLCRCK